MFGIRHTLSSLSAIRSPFMIRPSFSLLSSSSSSSSSLFTPLSNHFIPLTSLSSFSSFRPSSSLIPSISSSLSSLSSLSSSSSSLSSPLSPSLSPSFSSSSPSPFFFFRRFKCTFNQLLRGARKKITRKTKSPDLKGCPQKRGTVLKVFIMTPRKPNSAQRKVARVMLSNFMAVNAYRPGIGQQNIQKHSRVLVRGGKIKDLPGVKYTLIRGVYDYKRLEGRKTSRSKYGTKKPQQAE